MEKSVLGQAPAILTLLHVGCGRKGTAIPEPFRSEVWQEIRLDIDPAVAPDVIGSMTDLSAVADASVDAVYTSHTIEHLHAYDVPISLDEMCRVLKPDGLCVITCPDLQAAAEMVMEDKLLEVAYQSAAGPITAFDIIFSYRPLTVDNPFMWHRSGFTASLLGNLLVDTGFASVTVTRYRAGFALWAIATKVTQSDAQLAALRSLYFPEACG